MILDWQQVSIITPRLCLKAFSSTDATEIFSCFSDTLTQYMAWEPPDTLQQFAEIWQHWQEDIIQGRQLVLVIRRQTDQQFLGIAGVHALQSATPELGIWIREDCHGQGFGQEAIRYVVQWASSLAQYQHFIYPVALENIASRRIAEALAGTIQGQHNTAKYAGVIYTIPIMH